MAEFDDFLERIRSGPPSPYGTLTWDGAHYHFTQSIQFGSTELAWNYLSRLTPGEQRMVRIEVSFRGPGRPVQVWIYPRGDLAGVVRLGLNTARLRELADTPESGVQADLDL